MCDSPNGMCAKNNIRICGANKHDQGMWYVLFLVATVWSFAHLPLGHSDRNSTILPFHWYLDGTSPLLYHSDHQSYRRSDLQQIVVLHKKSSLVLMLAPISWRLFSKFSITYLHFPKFLTISKNYSRHRVFSVNECLEAMIPHWFYDLRTVKNTWF